MRRLFLLGTSLLALSAAPRAQVPSGYVWGGPFDPSEAVSPRDGALYAEEVLYDTEPTRPPASLGGTPHPRTPPAMLHPDRVSAVVTAWGPGGALRHIPSGLPLAQAPLVVRYDLAFLPGGSRTRLDLRGRFAEHGWTVLAGPDSVAAPPGPIRYETGRWQGRYRREIVSLQLVVVPDLAAGTGPEGHVSRRLPVGGRHWAVDPAAWRSGWTAECAAIAEGAGRPEPCWYLERSRSVVP